MKRDKTSTIDPNAIDREVLATVLAVAHDFVCDHQEPDDSMLNKDFLHGVLLTVEILCRSHALPGIMTNKSANAFILEALQSVIDNFSDGEIRSEIAASSQTH